MSEKTETHCTASISFESGDLKVTVSASGPNATEEAERLLDMILDYVDGDDTDTDE